MRILLIALGTVATLLGVVGIFVPGLPTTPFMLLASWCFYKGSKRMHKWLNDSFLGRYIRNYERRKGMTRRTKISATLMMWAMISISVCLVIQIPSVRIVVLVMGLIGTLCVWFVVPNAKDE